MSTLPDPYFVGRLSDRASSGKRSGGKPPLLAWLGVDMVNLIVPLWLGWISTFDHGRYGMLFGVAIVYGLGSCLCCASRWWMLTVVYGGWVVAVSQIMPILHVHAGATAIGAARALGQATSVGVGDLTSELDGFIATLVTGGLLLGVSAILGLVIRGFLSAYAARKKRMPGGVLP